MHILFINGAAFVICGVAFAITMAVGHMLGLSDEGPLMIVFGPLCFAMDAANRSRRPERRWFNPETGGSVFFIPVWLLGILWLVLGIIDTIRGRS